VSKASLEKLAPLRARGTRARAVGIFALSSGRSPKLAAFAAFAGPGPAHANAPRLALLTLQNSSR